MQIIKKDKQWKAKRLEGGCQYRWHSSSSSFKVSKDSSTDIKIQTLSAASLFLYIMKTVQLHCVQANIFQHCVPGVLVISFPSSELTEIFWPLYCMFLLCTPSERNKTFIYPTMCFNFYVWPLLWCHFLLCRAPPYSFKLHIFTVIKTQH